MTPQEYRKYLISRTSPLLMRKGVKYLTMDMVAKSLGISKRTLYEIFESKDNLIIECLNHMRDMQDKRMREACSRAGNMMEAMAIALKLLQRVMTQLNTQFFKDMDEHYSHIRPRFEESANCVTDRTEPAFTKGVEEGVFRKNVDYRIVMRLFMIQMESLKRMERYFPDDVSLVDAYNTISLSMLRSIATPKGIEILENIDHMFKPDYKLAIS